MNAHLAALHAALRTEETAEREEYARLDALAHSEQLAYGHAWPILALQEAIADGRRHLLSVSAPRGVPLHEGIAPGDPVWVASGARTIRGSVADTDGRRAQIVIDARDAEELSTSVRIYRRHDPATLVRYRIALERADTHRSRLKDLLLSPGALPLPETGVDEPHANPSQRLALAFALQSPELAVIWGPPGTGKTWLLARVLARLVARGEHPWALADSNAATDNLALAASAQGIDVVRLGPLSRVGAALRSMHIEAHIERSLYGPALATLLRDLRRAASAPAAGRLRSEYIALYQRARQEVLEHAELIATTFGTLARIGTELPRTVTAVVDEATQAIEPAIWALIPYIDRLTLAGDPAQLGPVVRTRGPLEVSLLQRLIDAGTPSIMLEEQHRMATSLRTLVAPVYGPRYIDAPGIDDSSRAAILEQHALWIDTAGVSGEQHDPVTASLYEPTEVELLALILQQILDAGFSADRVGVIAPYSAQVARLSAHPVFAGVEVATVNAFQGRERDVILVSFVRSNPDAELGFVADERRLTVAVTRARCQLVIVGDVGTLTSHPRFAALHATLEARGAVRSVWEPPYDAVLTQ